jgi:hypothetical protein
MSANNKYGQKVDDLQKAFTAFTGSTRQYIDPNSLQGKEITASIANANELMESLRPRWQKKIASETEADTSKVHQRTSPREKKISDHDIPHSHDDCAVHNASTASANETPKCNQSTIKILEGHLLFQLNFMKSELTSIERKAQALPSKFMNRAPQFAVIQPKPSSRLPPVTDGLTIVEQLMQLGERCHWVTQKSEHLWFYMRALDECLISSLLMVGPLFDTDKLVRIFQNPHRNDGSGVCSSALLSKVESMVKKMIRMPGCSDTSE